MSSGVIYALRYAYLVVDSMRSHPKQYSANVKSRRAPRQRPSARLRIGEILLARASVLETTSIERSLTRFHTTHEAYVVAQRSVTELDARLRACRARIHELDYAVNDAIETLARMLAADGRPLLHPFRGYSKSCPSLLRRMQAARKGRTIRALVAAVLRDAKLSSACAEAARGLERTLDALHAELPVFVALEAQVRQSRYARDAIAMQWDHALRSLRLAAQIAAHDTHDGLPHLHAVLFRKPLPRYSL